MADENNQQEAAWIRELAAILTETGLTEIEIEKDDLRVRVARGGQAVTAYAPPAPAAALAPAETSPAQSSSTAPADAVTSPMVGTAYLSPSPGAEPFVKPGSRVAKGQTLMIIEAMKTMNPIPSPVDGVVKQIVVVDAQPVEFGDPLLIVE